MGEFSDRFKSCTFQKPSLPGKTKWGLSVDHSHSIRIKFDEGKKHNGKA